MVETIREALAIVPVRIEKWESTDGGGGRY